MRRELALLHKQESQISSDIEHVKKSLDTVLVAIGQLVELKPGTTSTQEAKKTISSSASSEEKATGKRSSPRAYHEVAKDLLKKLEDGKEVNSDEVIRSVREVANSTNVSCKKEATKKANSSITNSTKVSSKQDAANKVQTARSTTSKASNAVAAISKKAKVQAVVQAQQSVLENLFQHLKGNIVSLNKEESSSKEVSQKQITRLEERLKEEEAKMTKKDLSKLEHEELINQTRTDKVELQFWTDERNLGHQMWHTNLKLQHGLMSRVRSVISACKEAVTKGHVDSQLIKQIQAQALPKAFLQMQSTVEQKTQQYYAHVVSVTDWTTWIAAQSKELKKENMDLQLQ